MADIKWSAFTDVGTIETGDTIVGLRADTNVQFAAGSAASLAASDPSKTNVASVDGITTSGHVAIFSDTNGTIEDGGALPGASPWTAGGGTDSAIGGDGTATAAGNFAIAYGDSSNISSADNTFTFGSGNTASNQYAFAFGNANAVSQFCSGAFGQNAIITKVFSYSFGDNNTINCDTSAAFGISHELTSTNSGNFAFGYFSQMSGSARYSFAGGYASTTSGGLTFTFGAGCKTNADYSLAMGNTVTATNAGSYVWGDSTGTNHTDTDVNQWVQTYAGGYYKYVGSTLAFAINSSGQITTANFPSGTWNPVITGSSANPTSITYAYQVGEYQQIGNIVFYTLRIIISALTIGAASGQLQISSPPITSVGTTANTPGATAVIQGLAIDVGTSYIAGRITNGTELINLMEMSSTGGNNVTMSITNLTSSSDISISGFYFSA